MKIKLNSYILTNECLSRNIRIYLVASVAIAYKQRLRNDRP